MRPKRGGRRRKFGRHQRTFGSCNPLKSTNRQRFVWKSLSKTRDFWRSWEKALRASLFRHRWLPPTSGLPIKRDRHCEHKATKQLGVRHWGSLGLLRCASRSSAKKAGGVIRKSEGPRFIQGDRLEDGAELAPRLVGQTPSHAKESRSPSWVPRASAEPGGQSTSGAAAHALPPVRQRGRVKKPFPAAGEGGPEGPDVLELSLRWLRATAIEVRRS